MMQRLETRLAIGAPTTPPPDAPRPLWLQFPPASAIRLH